MPVIIAADNEQATDYAKRLLDAARSVDGHVATLTAWGPEKGVIAFDVDDEVAAAAGFAVTENDDPRDPPAPASEPPARNASRATWAAYLDAQDPPVEYSADDGRDDLVALWDAHK